jgi:hypothetical protein
MKKAIGTLCTAVILGVGGIIAAPAASAWVVEDSACVKSGQTLDYCIGRFIESIDSMGAGTCDDACQPTAIRDGLVVVNDMMRSFDPNSHSLPPKKMFGSSVNETKRSNPWMTDGMAIGFVKVAIHWFGPPGLEDKVIQAMNAE